MIVFADKSLFDEGPEANPMTITGNLLSPKVPFGNQKQFLNKKAKWNIKMADLSTRALILDNEGKELFHY